MSDKPEHKTSEQQAKSREIDRKTPLIAGMVALGALLLIIGGNVGWLTAAPGNNASPADPPEIIRVAASTDRITPLSVITIACEAAHPDGGELTYNWSASDGEIRGDGPEVEWVAPATEGFYRVFVTVENDRGATAEESLALRVRENRPPEIPVMETDVGDDVGWVVPGASVYIWCEAEDADGDALTYEWSAEAGEVFGEGPAIIWVAPEELGTHRVTVKVDDGHGGVTERSIAVTVSAAEPPVIRSIRVEPEDRRFAKPHRKEEGAWEIYKGERCTFEAVVEESDREYTYRWSAEAGELSADGATAVWQAPSPPRAQWVMILLQASDAHGNQSSESVRIYVQTCITCM